ncbi:hypothetical protein EV361DRAFT_380203 [Lentinula raphanica]|nr:hypothetical protein EV361DRAFT_380203 [Lentinula raphanica]
MRSRRMTHIGFIVSICVGGYVLGGNLPHGRIEHILVYTLISCEHLSVSHTERISRLRVIIGRDWMRHEADQKRMRPGLCGQTLLDVSRACKQESTDSEVSNRKSKSFRLPSTPGLR